MNRLFMKWNPIIAIAVVFSLLAALSLQTDKAQAAPGDGGIEVQTRSGFQGFMKENKWFPVKLTLTNQTDSDLKGEVVVSAVSPMSGSMSDYVIPAVLPMQTAVELTFAIPGGVLNKDNSKIRFYKDSFQDGKVIPIIGNDYIDVRGTSSYTIGVISRDPDTFNFMPSLNQRGYDITVIPLTEEELPDDSILLEMIDTLVINDTATSAWSESKVQAIKDWVQKGGTLVLSGGAGYSKTAEAFQAIAPVEASGTTNLSTADVLASVGGAPLKLDKPITISTGKAVSGQTQFIQDGVPLAVSQKTGFGSVVYAAFDPSLEPLASWSGSAMLWAKLLQSSLTPLQPGMMYNNSDLYWGIQQLIDQFPSIKPPNFLLLLIMFAVYMVIAAPILYVVLAKTDRREWAWWLIPAISVVTGIAIFFFGAEDKREMSSHTIEVIELTGQGDGVRSGATGVFVPAGGTVKASFDERLHMISYPSDFRSGNLSEDGKVQFVSEEETTTAVWRTVPYWSTRKAWMDGRTMNGEAGQLSLKYEQNNGAYRLNVTNDTPSDLTNVSLLINSQVKLIGDLKQGESGSTAIPSFANSQSGYYNYGDMMFPYQPNQRIDRFTRQRDLVNTYMNTNNGIMSAEPVIIGFSIDHESGYTVNGKEVKSDNLKMWVQKLGEATFDGNRVVVPAGLLKPVIIENNLQRLEYYGNGTMSLGQGELIFEFLVPNAHKVNYDKLEVILNNNAVTPNLTWTIWHEASGKWVDATIALAAPSEYMIQQQTIRLKLVVTADTETLLPQIALEGEAKQK